MLKKTKKKRKKKKKDDFDEDEQPPLHRRKIEKYYNSSGKDIIQFMQIGEDPDVDTVVFKNKKEDGCHYLLIFIYDKNWDYYQKDQDNLIKNLEGVYGKFEFTDEKKKKGKIGSIDVRLWEKCEDKITTLSLLAFLEKYQKDKFGILKLIIYYTGHCEQIGNQLYPSFFACGENHNTHEIHLEILEKSKYELNIFIADCFSSKNKVLGGKIPKYDSVNTNVGLFDFVGNLYIRSCQENSTSSGDETYGSFFTFHLTKKWLNDWIETLKQMNRALYGIQEASGIGNIVKSIDRIIEINYLE